MHCLLWGRNENAYISGDGNGEVDEGEGVCREGGVTGEKEWIHLCDVAVK